MWADAQRDGHPAEYRWRPIRKFRNSILVPRRKVGLTPAAGVPCSNAANTLFVYLLNADVNNSSLFLFYYNKYSSVQSVLNQVT